MRCLRLWFMLFVASAFGLPVAEAGILFSDNFNSSASAQWGDEVGLWSATGGVYDAGSPSAFPNAHSSLPFHLSDFTVEFDVSRLQDGGVWLRSAANAGSIGRTGVLLVTGGRLKTGTGLYWHIVTDPNDYGALLNETTGLFVPGANDAHLKIVVSGNTYSAYVNNSLTPATTLTTTAFGSGRVALYDSSNQTVDNFVLSVPDSAPVPEPATISLLVVGAACVASGNRWKRRRSAGDTHPSSPTDSEA